MPDSDGLVKAEHYGQLIEQGANIPEAELPELPKLVTHIWEWWTDMNSERPNNGMGVSALSSKFMYDYLSVYSIRPMTIELKILKVIDKEYLESVNG